MKMTAKNNGGGGDFERPEPGNQPARLVALVDLGTVNKPGFKGKPDYNAHEIYLVWELVTQQLSGSTNNHVIGRAYTASLGDKANLRKLIEKWFGKAIPDGQEFDLACLLGQPCLLDVTTSKDGKWPQLDPLCASKVPKGMPCPEAKRKPVMWEIAEHDQLPEHLDWLPFLYGESPCDRIARSDEWKAKKGTAQRERVAVPDDDPPADPFPDGPDREEDIPF